ncbi:MAG: hypothetical protein JXR59_06310 [Desulfuromonadaceae bacterium]|nr:hypothetical protein [Desulfuromonadaceae bacterium]
MSRCESFSDLIFWSHRLAQETLQPGDLAVDLTVGHGRDSLHLAQCVDSRHQGTVLGFDIQSQAIENSLAQLENEGIPACRISRPQQVQAAGVFLTETCHARLSLFLPRAPKVVMANLGYLPGGDHRLVTRAETTCAALEQALEELVAGGRLILVVYRRHEGGKEESQAVDRLLQGLNPNQWDVLRLDPFNRQQAPYLLVAEKKQTSPKGAAKFFLKK